MPKKYFTFFPWTCRIRVFIFFAVRRHNNFHKLRKKINRLTKTSSHAQPCASRERNIGGGTVHQKNHQRRQLDWENHSIERQDHQVWRHHRHWNGSLILCLVTSYRHVWSCHSCSVSFTLPSNHHLSLSIETQPIRSTTVAQFRISSMEAILEKSPKKPITRALPAATSCMFCFPCDLSTHLSCT